MLQAMRFRRLVLATVILVAAMTWLEYRLIRIHWQRGPELESRAAKFTHTTRSLEAWRGEIRDRAGKTLAVSFPTVTVYADLTLCSNRIELVAPALAALLHTNVADVAGRLRAAVNAPPEPAAGGPAKAVVLKRHVSPGEWHDLTNALARATFGLDVAKLNPAETALLNRLRRKALFARPGQARLYPYGNALAHVLGWVMPGPDPSGLVGASGVEAVCNALLAGRPGVCESDQDAAGNELPFRRSRYVPAQDGHHVVLTIDMRLQQIVEQALLDAWTKHRPRSVSIIIVRPRTGEILAWGCLPGFAPREPGASPPEAWRNRPISDWFEPGSTFKVVTLAAALNEGLVGLDQGVDCERGLYRHKDFTVRDYAPHGVLTARQCLARSSSIGHAKLGLLLGADRLHRYATNFGFGRRTGIALPGETAGRLEPPQTWTPMTLSRIAFGQGLAASQLQSTLAMAAIANDGRLMRPLLVWRIESSEGRGLHTYQPQDVRTVISPRTAQAMKSALQSVVSAEGTALRAALENFTVAGKTGTAEKSDQRGYRPGAYYASFIGFFPVAEPELCISVALDEPQEGHVGGQVAAPFFHTVAEQAARCLNLTPDKRPPPAAANRGGLTRSIPETPRPALAASR